MSECPVCAFSKPATDRTASVANAFILGAASALAWARSETRWQSWIGDCCTLHRSRMDEAITKLAIPDDDIPDDADALTPEEAHAILMIMNGGPVPKTTLESAMAKLERLAKKVKKPG